MSEFLLGKNTIKLSEGIHHVDLSHTSHNEISHIPFWKPWLKGWGVGVNKNKKTEKIESPPHRAHLYLDKWT